MIKITLPDKSIKEFESDIDGQAIAKSISNSLAKSAVCIDVNGELKDLSHIIKQAKEYLNYEPIYQLYYSLLNVYLWDRKYVLDVEKLINKIKI